MMHIKSLIEPKDQSIIRVKSSGVVAVKLNYSTKNQPWPQSNNQTSPQLCERVDMLAGYRESVSESPVSGQ